jgi:Trk-type K+ transport system membrane component
VLVLVVLRFASGNKNVNVFNREISNDTIKQAITILLTAMFIVFAGTITISILNPNVDFIDIVFEVSSALATCGYSLGITNSLTAFSRFLLIVIMFIGRVSTVTMTMAIAGKKFKQNNLINYPKADVRL